MKQDSNAAKPLDGEPSGRKLAVYEADVDRAGTRKAGELLHSRALKFLNVHRDFSATTRSGETYLVGAPRKPGVRGALSRIRANIVRRLANLFLKDYFASEAEYHMSLVQFLNDASTYIDDRDGALFWELIRKVDYDITSARNRIEIIADSQDAELRSTQRELTNQLNSACSDLSQRIARIEASLEGLSGRAKEIDGVLRGFESLLTSGIVRSDPPHAGGASPASVGADVSYVLLENRFRGSEQEIRERLRHYVERFVGLDGTVLEIGSGRGELLELMGDAGVSSYGVDSDQAMVQLCQAKGLDSRHGDGIVHLESLAESSLAGVIAIQVVEHLPHAALMRLIRAASRAVRKGGIVVFETINPCSLTALSSNYFRDPSHVFPQHPDTLAFSMTLGGLDVKEVRFLSPVPEAALLREVPVEEYMTPRWSETVNLMNNNIKRLNDLLYGHQDYCVVAQIR